MRPEDERILEMLRRALEPDTAEPAPERVAAIRTMAERGKAGVQRQPRPTFRTALAGLAAALIVGAFAVGLWLGSEPPGLVRDAAHDFGLPVDSQTLVDAKHELDRLGKALATLNTEEALAADAEMLRLVKQLDEDEKAKIVPVAHEVHCRAVDFLGQTDPGCVPKQ